MYPQLVLLALICVGGKSIANQTKNKNKNKTEPTQNQKNKNPKYPNWQKAHKLITNPLTKEKTKTKPTQKRKKERKTLNTQIGKKFTQINNKPKKLN
jgi:hypothetical protein